jgi:hypothetical protein
MKLTLALAGGCWFDGGGCCLSARAQAGIHPPGLRALIGKGPND